MYEVLFNLHDVVLLITVYQCVLFGLFLFTLKKGKRLSNILLALFLLSHAAIPLDNLISFGEAFRQFAINYSPNFFYIFGTAYWLEAVFLLFYVRSLIYKNFRFTKLDWLYVLPFVVYVVYQTDSWFVLDTETKKALLSGYELADEPSYIFFMNLFRECFRAYCVLLCLIELRRYQQQIKNTFADIEAIDLTWLKILVVGFLIINVQAVLATIGVISSFELNVIIDYELIGLAANYTTLFLISFLIYFSLGFSRVFKGIEVEAANSKQEKQPIDAAQIDALVAYMEEHKPYLNHLLTLDSLANQLFMPARQLSQIINRHFKQNFFEFINAYRIEESKRLLQQLGNKKATMLDIMDQSGFNSKATFNTFFKKIVGLTPTQYKKEQLEKTRTA